MLGFLDKIALRLTRMAAFDDMSLDCRRVAGFADASSIIFLPWNTQFETAKTLRLLPRSFFSCYEMPAGIISSKPSIPARAVERMSVTVRADVDAIRARGFAPRFVAMSIGNFPATYLANVLRADLLSIASGDRGEWLTFNSPASRHIRAKAERLGHTIPEFEATLRDMNPVSNLADIGPESCFLFGAHDHFIPRESREALIERVRSQRPSLPIKIVPLGHLCTILNWQRLVPRPANGYFL